MIRRPLIVGVRLLAMVSLAPLAACMPSSHPITLENREDAEDFHQTLESYINTLDTLIQKTRKGDNISDFSMGMLTYSILTTLSAADGDLRSYITSGGQDVQGYLKTRFQDQPQQEVEALDRMNAKNPSPLLAGARDMLEALSHVPDSGDPPDTQKQSRDQLADALGRAREALAETAAQIRIR
jgi:hypothetical protein